MKRRRDDHEENTERVIRQLVDEERRRIDAGSHTAAADELFKLFAELQQLSMEYISRIPHTELINIRFRLSFNNPEIVVVGMQSDGKSTFVEALLGFQFNIVDTNIGTRRPLIIQV